MTKSLILEQKIKEKQEILQKIFEEINKKVVGQKFLLRDLFI
jgi:hypothetical protein